jgi:iron complex transport system ATP-binding protein
VLEGVAARYGEREVLSDVSLSLAPGRVVALLGENGSGKSTLLKILAGLLAPVRGTVSFGGRPLPSLRRDEAARLVAWLPQSFEPFFPSTALELVLLGRTPHLGPLAAPGTADRAAARAALAEVDGADLAERDVREISGGERQRVYLARVLAGGAPVLLLDEPTANLDPRHRYLVAEILRRRAAAGGLCILSTHEVDLAAAVADVAVLLGRGRVLAAGPISETLTRALLESVFGVPACVGAGEDGRPLVTFGRGLRE